MHKYLIFIIIILGLTVGFSSSRAQLLVKNTSNEVMMEITNNADVTIGQSGNTGSLTVYGSATISEMSDISTTGAPVIVTASGNGVLQSIHGTGNGQVLKWDHTASRWELATDATGIGTESDPVWSSTDSDYDPENEKPLAGNGINVSDRTVSVAYGSGLTLNGSQLIAQSNQAMWNADELQGTSITTTTPQENDFLKYSGGQWSLTSVGDNDVPVEIRLAENILPTSGVPIQRTSNGQFTVAYDLSAHPDAFQATISMACMNMSGNGTSKIWVIRDGTHDSSDPAQRRAILLGQCTAYTGTTGGYQGGGTVQITKVPLHDASGSSKSYWLYAQVCSGCTVGIWPYIVALAEPL
ncbi:hypothetical protein GF407_00200 [candidate division KSB1 bacterium]|nr:hypothetical protein [candidate division KSB1 bacterium]